MVGHIDTANQLIKNGYYTTSFNSESKNLFTKSMDLCIVNWQKEYFYRSDSYQFKEKHYFKYRTVKIHQTKMLNFKTFLKKYSKYIKMLDC